MARIIHKFDTEDLLPPVILHYDDETNTIFANGLPLGSGVGTASVLLIPIGDQTISGNHALKIDGGSIIAGPPAASQDAILQGYTGGAHLFTTVGDTTGVGIEAEFNDHGTGLYVATLLKGAADSGVAGVESDFIYNGTADALYPLEAIFGEAENKSAHVVPNLAGIHIGTTTNTGSGSITDAYGLFIEDQTGGVGSWAIRTGHGKVGFGDVVNVESTVTDITNPTSPSVLVNTNLLPAADGIYEIKGIFSELNVDASNTHNFTSASLSALMGEFDHSGAGNVNSAVGVAGFSFNESSGTIGMQIAGWFEVGNYGSGLVSDQRGVWIQKPDDAGHPVTNNYGLYIDDMGPLTSGATSNWAIKTGKGRVAIGDYTEIKVANDGGNEGLYVQLEATPTTESSNLYNVDCELYLKGTQNFTSGTVSAALYAYSEHDSTGTVAELAAMYADTVGKGMGAGAIANGYGLWVEDQTNATTNWAIKTGLGKVEFGDTVALPNGVTITTGTAEPPFSTQPNGSVYFGTTTGAMYVRISGAWKTVTHS